MVDLVFYVFAAVALGGAVGVVVGRSPVSSLVFMVVTLASMAGIFVLLEAHFLAAIQVIVYAGAIMVLFLFVIMLLNLGHDYRSDLRGGVWAVLAFGASGLMAGFLARQFRGAEGGSLVAGGDGAASIEQALAEHGAVGAIARPLFTDYVVPFEITGILLLVAIVGAIALAKRRVS
ncbi:MAG TPA: NADH-quinone oxidoreductase subunit J [Longimicrobiales bacterium]|nr:NADH-quinone oxidoreductase subunit J [Longimicrobiales bacterium]